MFVYFQNIANKIAQFMKFVHHGDLSKLQAVRESVLQMNAPLSLVIIMFCHISFHCFMVTCWLWYSLNDAAL